MKLKYYLRGLGIGMLVAALILTLSGKTDAKMSDEAVKRRAAELGMVEKDNTVLEDIGGETAEPESGAEESPENVTEQAGALENDTEEQPESVTEQAGALENDTEEQPESASEQAAAAENAEKQPEAAESETAQAEAQGLEENAAQQSETASAEDAAEREAIQEIENRADEVADRAEDVAENSPAGRVIMLEVRRGDSSVSVARRAAEAGLVQSAADFDVFLCRNGYDKRISIGNYEITEGASEKEIADIITKSR